MTARYDTAMQDLITRLLVEVGEDPTREGLVKTPGRVAQSMEYLTGGYRTDAAAVLNGALFAVDYNEMVIVRDIDFYSLCEHHLLPFFGKCHVAYIPNGRVVGLSKVPRLVDMYARRLQLQERMTNQIAADDPRGAGRKKRVYIMCSVLIVIGAIGSLVIIAGFSNKGGLSPTYDEQAA